MCGAVRCVFRGDGFGFYQPWGSVPMTTETDERRHTPIEKLGSRSRTRVLVLLAITIAGLAVCYLLLAPFLSALAWALALAVLFAPIHRRIEAKVHNRSVAALISVLLAGSVIMLPATLLGSRLVIEAAKGAVALKEKIESGDWRRAMEGHETLALVAQWIEQFDFQSAIGSAASGLAATTASLVQGWVVQLVTALLAFYLLFYFLRDRKAALDWLREISPLSAHEMTRLFDRIVDTVQATLYGTVAVAVLQGVLGGLMFAWLGLPNPLLWGLVMGLMAVIPVLGTFVIWAPVAVFLALEGSWAKALILAAWGTLVVGAIDNLLHPVLVGDRLRLHTIPAFISIVGGVILFGASGLILGPLVVTLTVFALEVWRVRIRRRASDS
jgi:predicted PurR-regulated permease PerM